jgi:hypothetical protein
MPKMIWVFDNSGVVIYKIHKKAARLERAGREAARKEALQIKEDLLKMISATDHPLSALRVLNKRNIGYAPGMKPPHKVPIVHRQSGHLVRALKYQKPQFKRLSPHEYRYFIGFNRLAKTSDRGSHGPVSIRQLLHWIVDGTSKMIPRDFFTPVLNRATKRYYKTMEEAIKAAVEVPE